MRLTREEKTYCLKGLAILLGILLAGLLWFAVVSFCLHYIDHGGINKNYYLASLNRRM
jgi:hypothetical protein